MAMEYKDAMVMFRETLQKLVASYKTGEYYKFLRFSGRMYKYSNPVDRIMIYGQNPDASACAKYDFWTKHNSYIKKDSLGIALLNRNEPGMLEYVFDIENVRIKDSNKKPDYLTWHYPDDDKEIIKALSEKYSDYNFSNLNELVEKYAESEAKRLEPIIREAVSNFFAPEELLIKYIKESIKYTILSRCDIEIPEPQIDGIIIAEEEFLVTNLNLAASCDEFLTDVSREVRKNKKTIEKNKNNSYNALKHESRSYGERGEKNGTDHIQTGRGLLASESGDSEPADRGDRNLGRTEKRLYGRTSEPSIHVDADKRDFKTAPDRYQQGSEGENGQPHEPDDESREYNRGTERSGTDKVGTGSDQHSEQSQRNSIDGDSVSIDYGIYDRKADDFTVVRFFSDDKKIRELLFASEDIKHNVEMLREFNPYKMFPEQAGDYIRNIFKQKDFNLEGSYGYRKYNNGLLLFEGTFDDIKSKAFYTWSQLSIIIRNMNAIGMFGGKEKEQLSMFENENIDTPTDYFTDDLIDIALLSGSGFIDGKYRIYEYLLSHTHTECIDFLKNEYGTGGRSSILTAVHISENHSAKGIELTDKENDKSILLPWSDVEKRIRSLIENNQYLSKEEEEFYKNKYVKDKDTDLDDNKPSESLEKIETAFGSKRVFNDNIRAIRIVKGLNGRKAEKEEIEVLKNYHGWGGVPEAFDENNKSWEKEYNLLKEILDKDEYNAARSSVLNAHFTSTVIVNAIYRGLNNLGIKGGNVLEPSCGNGVFFEHAKEYFNINDTKMTGVELDGITSQIAQAIYPDVNVINSGFEECNFDDDTFDAVIGNVPFGDYKILDPAYKDDWLIHDYFFIKSVDKVKPGGIVALITSSGTMDKKSSKLREVISQKAELLGAIRLPNTAFKSAGTSVTADILFLQKKVPGKEIENKNSWLTVAQDDNGFTYNEYFIQNPEMVIGQITEKSGQFGMELTCADTGNTAEKLLSAIDKLHTNIKVAYEIEKEHQSENESETITTEIIDYAKDVENYSFFVYNDKLYFKKSPSNISLSEQKGIKEERTKHLINIKNSVKKVIDLQLNDHTDNEIREAQAELNNLYDEYNKKYGRIRSVASKNSFSEDISYPLLLSLEMYDDNGEFVRKSDIFDKRTIAKKTVISHVDTAAEAVTVSLSEKAKIDIKYMSELTGQSEENIVEELKGIIFKLPDVLDENGEPVYVTADEYLSGKTKEKLAVAEKAALEDEEYKINVSYLQKAQPEPLNFSDIDVQLGATWVPEDIIEDFIRDIFEPSRWAFSDINVTYNSMLGLWNIQGKSADRSINATNTYGTSRMNAYHLLERALNLKTPVITDLVFIDGEEKRVPNRKETFLACQKQDLIKQKFKEWVWNDQERRDRLTKIYNDNFNNIVPRKYNGEHLEFPGMNPLITLKPHQKNAVARQLYGGNSLLAHVVGAGKTYTMIAAAMEAKRLGLASKSMFVVPNHLIEQWTSEFMTLYPGAKILASTKKDFIPQNRKEFTSRIATGDFDAVIIGHSQFEKLELSEERQKEFLSNEIENIIEAITLYEDDNNNRFTVKRLESKKKTLEAKLKKLNDTSKKDKVLPFEALGIDRLFVDEAHGYKNLALETKMNNVAGVNTTAAMKSSDMYAKCRYMDEITNGRGICFATGTPVSNSMSEMYTMQKYLQYDELKEHSWLLFDSWASQFGETMTSVELSPEGTGYRQKTRFAKFHNLPELINVFSQIADIQTSEMLDLPTPNVEYVNTVIKPSEFQKEYIKNIGERADKVRNNMVDAKEDNMLKITSDGRKVALDERLIDVDFEKPIGERDSKISAVVENAYNEYVKSENIKGTQMIFCDLSTPKKDEQFSVYHIIRNELIKRGVNSDEIEYIHNADTDDKKAALFSKVRSGKVRFLLGSTTKMGAGTNVQDRMVALHHMDVPWKPSDIEQREGRIARQGNINENVRIYKYVTEGTFDSYSWQIIETKQRFISQIMTNKAPARSFEDMDEATLNYAEVKALAAGNPAIKEKMELDVDVSRLKTLKSQYLETKYKLENDISVFYPKAILECEEKISNMKKDIDFYNGNKHRDDDFNILLNGRKYTERKEAGMVLNSLLSKNKFEQAEIGEYCGFKIIVKEIGTLTDARNIMLRSNATYTLEMGDDPLGNIMRISNYLSHMDNVLDKVENKKSALEKDFSQAKEEVVKPFLHEDELKEKEQRLKELNLSLSEDEQNIDEEKESIVSINPMRKKACR